MYRRLLFILALATTLSLPAYAPVWAQDPSQQDQSEQDQSEQAPSQQQHDADTGSERADAQPLHEAGAPSTPDLPASPAARVERAERAFEDSDFNLIRPLLEPLLLPDSKLDDPELEQTARTLLGVGLYFEAQQVTDATERSRLLERAETQFVERLRAEPDRSLNALIYPASVVEFFESVMDEHAEELDAIRAERDASSGSSNGGLTSVYIEREVGLKNYAANFMPFGVGQFQNGDNVQGTLFATAQGAALGLNIVSYWMIESLRGPEGTYEPGAGNSLDHALQWRTAQYVGLGVFTGLYLWSVLDALYSFERQDIRIRTLDEPPPELRSGQADDKGATFQIGLGGVGVSW